MPIEGLPNPQIHRMCKRCRQWFMHHEVDLCWPPRTGLLTWVHVTLAESTDQQKERKAYCRPCQEKNLADETRFRRQYRHALIISALIAVAFLAAWALGVGDMIKDLVSGGGSRR